MALWFKPALADVEAPGLTILSNGGHTPNGDGIYIKQVYGNQYEVGVALVSSVWKTSFSLTAEKWVHLGLSWSDAVGLTMYVDGLVQASVTSGGARDSSSSDYTASYSMQLGLDRFGQPLTSSARFTVSDITVYDDLSAIASVIEPLGTFFSCGYCIKYVLKCLIHVQ